MFKPYKSSYPLAPQQDWFPDLSKTVMWKNETTGIERIYK